MGLDFINSPNQDFSRTRKTERTFGQTDFEEDIKKGTIHGEYNRFLKVLVPVNPLTGKSFVDSQPKLGDEFETLKNKSNAFSQAYNDIRDAEGLIFINGRRIPGVFQGFNIRGGVFVERFDQKKHRLVTKVKALAKELLAAKTVATFAEALALARKQLAGGVDIPKGAQLFQVDKGVKPFTGSANFVLLDDLFSTALQKSREFIRIMTHFRDGEDQKLGLNRVFKMESFLNGADRPFNFTTIKIIDFACDMPIGMEGRINASYDFEQFDIFKGEIPTREPETPQRKVNRGIPDGELSIDANPILDEPITVPI